MTKHQPGTVLPLSECKPGWLVDIADWQRPRPSQPMIRLLHQQNTDKTPVTLISAAPGWTPNYGVEPKGFKLFDICWQNGRVDRLRENQISGFVWWEGSAAFPADGKILFWRDASADTPAQSADLAARLSAVEELTDRLARAMWPMSYTQPPAPTFPLPDVQHSFTDALGKTLDFRTSRKSEPGEAVMTDDEIVRKATGSAYRSDSETPLQMAARIAVELTRASIRAQLAANTQAGRDAAYAIWNAENGEHDSVKFAKAIRAAIRAHGEGV